MTLSAELVGATFASRESRWTRRDTALYALGIGAGQADPADELEFTTHGSRGRDQRAYPTFGVLAGGEAGVTGMLELLGDDVDLRSMLHGEQRLEQFTEIPAEAEVVTDAHISAIWDKGSATVVETTAETRDRGDGTVYCRAVQSMFFRGVGGWGGERGPATPSSAPAAPADTAAVTVLRTSTRRDQALLYRLSGDLNPLHVDPDVARSAGFDRPILHGLCVYGIAGRLLLRHYADGDPARFRSLSVRFSKPCLPGDEIAIECSENDDAITFVAKNQDGDTILSSGEFRFHRDASRL